MWEGLVDYFGISRLVNMILGVAIMGFSFAIGIDPLFWTGWGVFGAQFMVWK